VTIQGFDINKQIAEIKKALESEKNLSPAMVSMIKMLILIVQLLTNKSGLNSRNSSKPPSSDQKGSSKKDKKKDSQSNKQGGQTGHNGSTLKQVKTPDEIQTLEVDRSVLPAGQYTDIGYEKRQVFDICIKRIVLEYQAQVLVNENGKRYVAQFPKGVTKATQYGSPLKAHALYVTVSIVTLQSLKGIFHQAAKHSNICWHALQL